MWYKHKQMNFNSKKFVEHGIGRDLHEDPEVPNFGRPGICPIWDFKFNLKSSWTVVTSDGSLSAHYGNIVAILPDGPETLTLVK